MTEFDSLLDRIVKSELKTIAQQGKNDALKRANYINTNEITNLNKKVMDLQNILGTANDMIKRIESLESKVAVQDEEMEEQGTTTSKLTPPAISIVENWVTVVSRSTQNQKNESVPKLPSNQSEVLNSIFVEKSDGSEGKKKLLIFGVSQSSKDANEATKQVETIFNKIGKEPRVIAHSRRFRQTDPNKPAPIFVRLSEGSDRYKVIAAAKKLRSVTEFRNVFINPDRTEAERELDRQLRQRRGLLNKEVRKVLIWGGILSGIFAEINCSKPIKSPMRELTVSPQEGPTAHLSANML